MNMHVNKNGARLLLTIFPCRFARAMLALLMLALGAGANAEEIRQLPSAGGGTIPYLLDADLPETQREAAALAILFSGGAGTVRLLEHGIPQPGSNFLVRTRSLFVARGVAVAVIDTPSEMRGGMSDAYRMSERHTADVALVADDLQKQFPGKPLFLVGTSRGTVSAAYAGAVLSPRLAGIVLTSSLFNTSREGAGLAGFDFEKIKAPLLFVHHVDDGCRQTPYHRAKALSDKYPLISVHGGKDAQSGPCEPFAAHGYYGKEEATVDAIVNWMRGRPYAKDVE